MAEIVKACSSPNASPSPRPRFECRISMDVPTILGHVQTALHSAERISGMVLPSGRIELTVVDADRHLWSPQLTVDVEAGDEGFSTLRARFGPHPHVWTLYVALYAISVIFAIACAVVGASQMVLGTTPWALWWTPAAVVLAGLVYGASYVGQGLGSEQMYRVRAFLEDALEFDADAPAS